MNRLILLLAALCFAGCASAPKDTRSSTERELDRLGQRAREVAYQDGHANAIRLYEEGLVQARKLDLSPQIAAFAHDLAICLVEVKHYDAARRFIREAQAEYRRSRQPTGGLGYLIARIDYESGEAARAEQLLLALPAQGGHALNAQLLLARIRIEAGDAQGAANLIELAESLAGPTPEPQHGAQLARLRGQVLDAIDAPGSAEQFDRETEFLRRAGLPEVSESLARAGAAYSKAGALEAAFDRYYRAARSAFAQGDEPSALQRILLALDQADALGDEERIRLAGDLFRAIEGR